MASGQAGPSPSLGLLCLQMPSCPGRADPGQAVASGRPPLLSQAAPDDMRPEQRHERCRSNPHHTDMGSPPSEKRQVTVTALPDSNSPESDAPHQELLEGLGCGPKGSVICKCILEPNVRVINSLKIKRRLSDHFATEGKGKGKTLHVNCH